MATERIIVAEDDPVTLRFVSTLLSDKGYEVLEAEDGETALDLALMHMPDLIISDIVMPYRDGFGFIRELRSQQALANIPVIILSMRDREDDIVRGFEEGADDYVVKPFNARELVARVKKLLQRSAAS